MLYGSAKSREMARSLLPSTARRGAAKDLAGIRRCARRRLTQRLRVLTGPAPAVADRWDDVDLDSAEWPQRQIKEAVWERRRFDKVAPFQRWAVASTSHLEPGARLNALGTMVPEGLMGRHALSHVDFLDHFCGHLAPRWRPIVGGVGEPAADYEALLRRVLAEGRLGEFNRWMKRREFALPGVRSFRTLEGAHDVASFVEDCRAFAQTGRRHSVAQSSAWFEGLLSWADRSASNPDYR